MVIYNADEKNITIPNGIGNLNLVINQEGDTPDLSNYATISYVDEEVLKVNSELENIGEDIDVLEGRVIDLENNTGGGSTDKPTHIITIYGNFSLTYSQLSEIKDKFETHKVIIKCVSTKISIVEIINVVYDNSVSYLIAYGISENNLYEWKFNQTSLTINPTVTLLGGDTTELENRVDAIENRTDTIETDVDNLESRVTELENNGGGSSEGGSSNILNYVYLADSGTLKKDKYNGEDVSIINWFYEFAQDNSIFYKNIINIIYKPNGNYPNYVGETFRLISFVKEDIEVYEEYGYYKLIGKSDNKILTIRFTYAPIGIYDDYTFEVTEISNGGGSGGDTTELEDQITANTTRISNVENRVTELENNGGGSSSNILNYVYLADSGTLKKDKYNGEDVDLGRWCLGITQGDFNENIINIDYKPNANYPNAIGEIFRLISFVAEDPEQEWGYFKIIGKSDNKTLIIRFLSTPVELGQITFEVTTDETSSDSATVKEYRTPLTTQQLTEIWENKSGMIDDELVVKISGYSNAPEVMTNYKNGNTIYTIENDEVISTYTEFDKVIFAPTIDEGGWNISNEEIEKWMWNERFNVTVINSNEILGYIKLTYRYFTENETVVGGYRGSEWYEWRANSDGTTDAICTIRTLKYE